MKKSPASNRTFVSIKASPVFGITENMIITNAVVKFRNGETHVIGLYNGVKVEFPEIFFIEQR